MAAVPDDAAMELDGTPRTQVHLVALPHTELTKAYDWCAYTAKLRRFTHMILAAGRVPVVYGPDVHECADGTIYVPIVGDNDRERWFGTPKWNTNAVFDQWDVAAACWQDMGRRAAVAIAAHWQPGDIIGLIAGRCQQVVLDLLAEAGQIKPIAWEWGIGYSGVLSGSHKTYESYAWAHHVAGLQHADDIRFFDSVIPNCFDLDDFAPSYKAGEYLLFMGRPTPRKGLPILAEIAKRTSIPIKVAGQPGVDIPGTEHVGMVTGQEKADLLAGALALLAPTTYLEPFGGVAVEAMLSGTPAITTDWGGFTETVEHGVTGYRCRTLREFLDAIDQAADLNRWQVCGYTRNRYSLDVGAELYGRVLDTLDTLHGDGWYAQALRPSTTPR